MAKITAVQQHAIDRYMERTGSKHHVRCLEKLWVQAEFAIPLGGHRYYAQGWIIVIVHGTVKTIYRPRTPEQHRSIYEATQRHRKKTPAR